MASVESTSSWMTSDEPFTHQLGRFSDECKPWLLRWFPELASCDAGLENLDRLIAEHGGDAGIQRWISDLTLMCPELKAEYVVPKIPADDHDRKNPYDELVQMRGTDEGVELIRVDGK